MQWFIHQQNHERYRRLLAQTADESERRQISKLLAEEDAKDRQPTPARAGAVAEPVSRSPRSPPRADAYPQKKPLK
jgi:hypothetical protein